MTQTATYSAVGAEELVPVRVTSIRWESDGVISLELGRPDGAALPAWDAGAHIDILLPSGQVRQYSLTGAPWEPGYRIAVLREAEGRGGSVELHDTVRAGQILRIRPPRNHFVLEPAASYLFLAGGIGITPILAMIHSLEGEGRAAKIVYGGRTRSSMAFLAELECVGRWCTVELVPEDERGLIDLAGAIGQLEPGALIYACGPAAMLTAVEHVCAGRQISDRLRLERFTAGQDATGAQLGSEAVNTEIEVELARSAQVVLVPPDVSILHAIRDIAPVLSSCEEGYCGTCETRVLEGIPEHRDTVLTEAERQSNKTMMTCVSRALTPRLVLDV
jgi:ferredoxin-NADP reductase